MDDHLFLNLRTVCSRLVTVGEMKISYFLHFLPLPLHHSHLSHRPASAEDGETSAGERSWKKIGRVVGTGCRRATTSGTFLCLWQTTAFSPLSWPQHLLLQIRLPPPHPSQPPPRPAQPGPHVLATVTFKVFHRWGAASSPSPPLPLLLPAASYLLKALLCRER